jgi:GR25 family glycosyltransferase involved in LPS biosynthesis
MKSFIIHVTSNKKSVEYANICLQSCQGKFDAQLFEGVTPDTLHTYEAQYPFTHMVDSRAKDFSEENKLLYKIKKSCFMNHVRLWNKCIELNETIAVIEQDSFCVRSWQPVAFDDVLIMNFESAWNQRIFKGFWKEGHKKPLIKEGIFDYENNKMMHYHRKNNYHDSYRIPGTAAYAVTVQGATKLLASLKKNGWEQSDYFVNNKNVRLQAFGPEFFTFKMPNLNMSHGKHL